jgi:hypothetical protein
MKERGSHSFIGQYDGAVVTALGDQWRLRQRWRGGSSARSRRIQWRMTLVSSSAIAYPFASLFLTNLTANSMFLLCGLTQG